MVNIQTHFANHWLFLVLTCNTEDFTVVKMANSSRGTFLKIQLDMHLQHSVVLSFNGPTG